MVLAAGEGARLGSVAKALLKDEGGVSFLAKIAACCDNAGISERLAVLGPPHENVIRPRALELGFSIVSNPLPERGMASSIAVGFRALETDADAALLWPVDIPWVEHATVVQICAAADPARIVIPTHSGKGGHPPAVGRQLWSAMATCADKEEGARSVFRDNQERVTRLPTDDMHILRDVDRPIDLRGGLSL